MKNKEIKFRVWDKDSKKLLGYEFFNTSLNNGFFYIDLGELKEGEDELDLACRSEFHSPPMLKPKGFSQLYREQFIGLKDKNGKDIYEGDICLILYTDWPSNSSDMPLDEYLKSISHKGIIEYHDFSFHIMIKNRYDELSKNSLYYGKHGRIEVIGNIHENPELC